MASEGPISALPRVLSRRVLGSFRKRDEKRGKSQALRGTSKVSQKVPPKILREYLDEREKRFRMVEKGQGAILSGKEQV